MCSLLVAQLSWGYGLIRNMDLVGFNDVNEQILSPVRAEATGDLTKNYTQSQSLFSHLFTQGVYSGVEE
jgi:hypothetical protein